MPLKHRIFSTLLVTGTMVALGSTLASASVVSYTDTFARDGNLNGSSPSSSTNAATWTANSNFVTTSSPAEASVATTARLNNGRAAYLPMSVAAGEIATVTVTLTPTGGASDSNWLAVGFVKTPTTGNPVTNDFYTNAEGFILYRGGGGTQYYSGPSAGGSTSTGGTATHGTPDTFTIVVNDSVPANPTITFSDTLHLFGLTGTTKAYTTAEVAAIQGVSIGKLIESGTYTNFSASVTVPEPASLSLLGLSGLTLLKRRRRV